MVSLEDRVRLDVFQNRVDNLASVIIPSYLDQLQQQKRNITTYQEDEEWEKLSQEQRKATKTIKQLRTHIIELEGVKEQVNQEELDELNLIIAPIQQKIMTAVSSFQEMELSSSQLGDFVMVPPTESFNMTAQLWNELQEDLEELRTLNRSLLDHVQGQGDNVDALETQVDEAGERIRGGMLDIASTMRIRANMLPIGGAILGGVVGTVIGGPIGFLAGSKIGAITTIAGGAAGVAGGTYLGIMRGKSLEEQSEQLVNTSTNENKKDQ